MKTFYIGSSRAKLTLACQEVLKHSWPSMNQNRLLFVQIQTLPLILNGKETRENYREQTPKKKPHRFKG